MRAIYSNKVYAADLNASVDGVYDLYRKDGNASAGTPLVQAEVADGSVTTAKLDSTILKYLKPEITAQPQAQTVYADTNALSQLPPKVNTSLTNGKRMEST